MKKAFVFPGQGAQCAGMGQELYENLVEAKQYFERANELLGFRITDLMFAGTDEDLLQTKVTQPAVFLHSVIAAIALGADFQPDMVAGHSLGEFSALTAAGALTFDDGLMLVFKRALAMQKACDIQPSTMAVITGSDVTAAEAVCAAIKDEVVVPANYNNPNQLVISGSRKGVEMACAQLKEMKDKVKRVLPLKVNGAFHSPLMEPARVELAEAIEQTPIVAPRCPIYQNVDALPHTNPDEIKRNLIAQLTSPVRWTQSVQHMLADGADEFTELGPGSALTGMINKIRNA